MREALVSLLVEWGKAALEHPWRWGGIGAAVSLAVVALLAWMVGGYLRNKTTRVAPGPLFVAAGLAVLAGGTSWALADALLAAWDAPLIGDRLFMALIPDVFTDLAPLRDSLGLDDGIPLRLPRAVTLPLGVAAGGLVYVLLVTWFGRTLSEMKALEQKPDDVLRRERLEAKKRAEEAKKAGKPLPEEQVVSLPLSDDRFGRTFKLLGHWTSVEHVELRYVRWMKPLVTGGTMLLLLTAAAALHGELPVPLWVGAAIALDSLRRNLRTPPAPEIPTVPETATTEEETAEEEPPPPGVPELVKRVGARLGPEVFVPEVEDPAPLPVPTGDVAAGSLLGAVRQELGLSKLYPHQAQAVRVLDQGGSVLVATPPQSGRRALMDLMTFDAGLTRGEGVLHLAVDPAGAAAAEARFDERARRTHWKWNVLATNLSGGAGSFDPTRSQPTVVFADPETLHRLVVGRWQEWRTYLAGLGLVLLPDLHRRGGPHGAHLTHLLRRLRRVIALSRSPHQDGDPVHRFVSDAASGAEDAGLRFLATSDPAHRDLAGFAERLAGCAFVRIGTDADGAPRPRQSHRTLPALAADEAVAAVGAAAGALGLQVTAWGWHGPERAHALAQGVDPGAAAVVFTDATPARHAPLPTLVSHLGWRRPKEGDAPQVLIVRRQPPEPMTHLLAATQTHRSEPLPPGMRDGPALVATPRSPHVERAHLRCTLAEAPVTGEGLRHGFSARTVESELAALRAASHVIARDEKVLDVAAGRVRSVETFAFGGGTAPHAETPLDVAGEAALVVDGSSDIVLRRVERARALAAAYPGRVLRGVDGTRHVVLAATEQDGDSPARVVCVRTEEDVLTTPIREVTVTLQERRDLGGASEETKGERRNSPRRDFGAAPFSLQLRRARIEEVVLGLRRHDPDGRLRDTSFYDDALRCQYEAEVTLMGFDIPPLDGLDAATVHALAHAMRAVLPALVHHDPDEDLLVDAANVKSRGHEILGIAFIDLHPGGSGFASAVDLEVLRATTRWSLELIRNCPAGCSSAIGCPKCIGIWRCYAAPEQAELLDKPGAERVLAALLGT